MERDKREKLKTLRDIAERMGQWGERDAIVALRKEDIERWNFKRLQKTARSVAAGLRDAGVKPADHVVLIAGPSPAWVATCLGVIEAGAVPTPLDVQISGEHLEGILQDVAPPVILTQKSQLERIGKFELEHSPRIFALDAEEGGERDWRKLESDAEANEDERETGPTGDQTRRDTGPAADEADEEAEAVLFFTSGTTGPPKGVPLSHRNLAFQINTLIDTEIVSEGDRLLNPLPLHHVYPFVIGMLTPLALGVPLVLPHSLTGPQVMRAMREGEVTIVTGVPRLYRALVTGVETRVENAGRIGGGLMKALMATSVWLRRRLHLRTGKLLLAPLHKQVGPDLRVLASGGSALAPELAWKLEGLGWKVAGAYGLTETSPMLTIDLPGDVHPGTVGRPLEGVEIRIDPSAKERAREEAEGEADQQNGEESDGSEPAERKNQPDSDDEKRHEAEQANSSQSSRGEGGAGRGVEGEILARGPGVFSGYRNLPDKTAEALDDDGWFHTGDLGFIDDDGFLHVTGRVSTMIVTEGGENVYPEDVEEAYEKHAAIKEAAVLEKDGSLVAILVPDPSAIGGTDPDEIEEAMRRAVEEQSKSLESFKRLADYALTRESIPRTRLGKPRRHLLEELYDKAKESGAGGGAEEAGPMSVDEMSDEDRALMDQPTAREVWDWLAERFSDRRLTPSTNPQMDLGVDSLEWLNLTMEIRERTGVELTEEAVGRIETVRDLLGEVVEASEAGDMEQTDPLEHPEEVLKEDQKRWLQPLSGGQRATAKAFEKLNATVMRAWFKVEVEGLDRLLRDSHFLITPNHASYLDPFAVAAALRFERLERTFWAGWSGITLANPLFRWGSRLAQVVPIEKERAVVSSLAFGAAVLKREHNLIWFPEGKRSETGELLPFQSGVGMLVDFFQVPVVPVFIQGAHEALAVGAKWPKGVKIRVLIGEPIPAEQLISESGAEDEEGRQPRAQAISKAIRRHVADLGGVEFKEEAEKKRKREQANAENDRDERQRNERDERPHEESGEASADREKKEAKQAEGNGGR